MTPVLPTHSCPNHPNHHHQKAGLDSSEEIMKTHPPSFQMIEECVLVVPDERKIVRSSPAQSKSRSNSFLSTDSEYCACNSMACSTLSNRTRSRSSSSPISCRVPIAIEEPPVVEKQHPLTEKVSESRRKCSRDDRLCRCEVALHTSPESCWLVANGSVYDIPQELLVSHPGGMRSILRHAGGYDTSQDLEFHSRSARKVWESCRVGPLRPCAGSEEERVLRRRSSFIDGGQCCLM